MLCSTQNNYRSSSPRILIEVEKMRLQYVHVMEGSVEGEQQASPELELEQDKEADLAMEAAEEQGQVCGLV